MSDIPQFGQVAIYQHLRALIGSPNAWRTSGELCAEIGAVSEHDKLRVHQGLHKLAKDGRITRKTRPGTKILECMALILDEKDMLRAPRTKAAPPRAEIITPASGPVGLKQEAVPAPALPEPSPEAREAVERLVRSPTPALTLADVLRKHGRSATVRDPKAAQTGPLSDSNVPISSDTEAQTCSMPPPLPETQTGLGAGASEGAAVVPYIEEVSNPAPFDAKAELAGIAARYAADDDDDSDPTVELEIASLIELANRGSRRVLVERVPDKVNALVMLAEALRIQFDSSRTAALLDEIVADLERVAAQA